MSSASSTRPENEKCLALLKKYGQNRPCLEVLQFFGKYPGARFSRLAILHALNNGPSSAADRSLQSLAAEGLLVEKQENGVVLYSLSGEMHDTAVALATYDWPQWQLFLQHGRPNPHEIPVINKKCEPTLVVSPPSLVALAPS